MFRVLSNGEEVGAFTILQTARRCAKNHLKVDHPTQVIIERPDDQVNGDEVYDSKRSYLWGAARPCDNELPQGELHVIVVEGGSIADFWSTLDISIVILDKDMEEGWLNIVEPSTISGRATVEQLILDEMNLAFFDKDRTEEMPVVRDEQAL